MKLNDMIFVIENRKGTVEANFLLTLDDTIEMLKQSGEYSMKETAAIFSELGRTMTEPDWEVTRLFSCVIAEMKAILEHFSIRNLMMKMLKMCVLIMKDAVLNVRKR